MASLAAKSDSELQAQLQATLNVIPAYTWYALPSGTLAFVNERTADYLGLPKDHSLRFGIDTGASWDSHIPLLHPDDQEETRRIWSTCLRTGRAGELSFRVRNAEGGYRWFLSRAEPLRASDGTLLYWIGVNIEIEKRKQAEFYLAEAQRLAQMGSWAFDSAGFDYWSPELFRIYGLDPSGKTPSIQQYLNCIHPQDREPMANLIEGILAEPSPFDATKRIVRPDGEIRFIRCVGAPVFENQALKKYVGSAIDVTEHEILTQELRKREAYLAEAQKLSHTGSFGWKPDSGEIVWSDETYRIFEYDPARNPTLNMVLQRMHPDDRALAQEVIEGASKSGSDFEHEYRLLMPSGAIKHIHVRAHAVHESGGNIEFIGAVTDITGRKTADEKIRRLVDANILGVFIGSVEGTILEANEAFLRMLQYDHEDLVSGSLRWMDLTPPEWRERDERALERLNATGSVQPYEKEYFRKDGSRVPVLVGGALLEERGDKGVSFTLDLSEQKRAAEALWRSEAYLAEAQRLSHTGSFAWSLKDGIRYWSDECYRVLGFDPREGLPLWEDLLQRIHPDDQQRNWEVTQRAINEKVDVEVEYRIVHPGGAVRHIHSTGHPVFGPSGDLIELMGTVIDITERKRAEERLREQEAELRQILDFTPQLVAVYGPDRERLYANRSVLDYLGVGHDEWLQRGHGISTHPDDWERVKGGWDRALESGSGYEVELRLRKHDGSYRWFLARYNPVRDDKGRIMRWYVAGTDIEDRKRAEERLQQENVALREEIDHTSMFEEIVGTSSALKNVLSRISKVAPSDSTVLITGETGTGKELVARAIHRRSHRSSRAFVSVNCAAIPRDLIASELFGHEKGAFTGATQRRVGRFELADGGTIFLDEVGELSPDTQVALLRVLQEREFERIGGIQSIHVDVRVITATNRDLNAAVSNGAFRQDLFYRLNVFPIEVPALRDRKDDILMLVEYFVQRYAAEAGKRIRSIDKGTLALLRSYDWPGNIRELQNVIERSVILSSGDVFSVDELWLSKETSMATSRVGPRVPFKVEGDARSEREIIEAALADTRGRVFGPSGAAAKLGIPPSTLDHRIKTLKINKRRFKFR